VEQKPKSHWRPTKNQIVRVIKVAAVLLITVMVISIIWLLWRDDIWSGGNSDYVLRGVLTVGLILILIGIGYRFEWTGFGETTRPKSETQEVQPRKTLWDWLGLLIVPFVLAAGGILFAWTQEDRQQAIEEQRAENERKLEIQRAQDTTLQAYLDQMSQLMLNGNLRDSEEDSEVRILARARTQTVFTRLDGRRKGSVVQFLYEASLINKERSVVSLLGVHLRGADLNELDLIGADLSGADLTDADLSSASLNNTDLSGAALRSTNLSRAVLSGANLSDADLSDAVLNNAVLIEADLSRAKLNGANLSGANLSDAVLSNAVLTETDLSAARLINADLHDAYLSHADLSGAEGVSNEELEQQAGSLKGATMPNGQKYEDWLKSKASGEDAENT
jgi:uncharacterized protein YjbI with pentapeptide repeats